MSKLNHLIGLIKRYEMTGEPGLEIKMAKLKGDIEDCLKLQQLVKEKLEETNIIGQDFRIELYSLVEESQKTLEVEGS